MNPVPKVRSSLTALIQSTHTSPRLVTSTLSSRASSRQTSRCTPMQYGLVINLKTAKALDPRLHIQLRFQDRQSGSLDSSFPTESKWGNLALLSKRSEE
jgi:hypothetical protein